MATNEELAKAVDVEMAKWYAHFAGGLASRRAGRLQTFEAIVSGLKTSIALANDPLTEIESWRK